MASSTRSAIGKIGTTVSTTPALRPTNVVLKGRTVTISRLKPEHAAQMYPTVGGEKHTPLWTYMFGGPYNSLEEFQTSIDTMSQSSDPFYYAIVDNKTQSAVGHASLMRIEPVHRVIEVGNIMYSPALQRSRAATEAMYLLAKHVFEDLGYRRYEWKCDNYNEPSKVAAGRLGFTFEGVFRQHIIYKGRSRDTAWYSMLDAEWQRSVKGGFERWLDDGNFDGEGRQVRRLQDCRGAA